MSRTSTNHDDTRASLGEYSLGVGDRFAHQARAQLGACVLAARHNVEIIPVWNKSHREHTIVGSTPDSVRAAAEVAVAELKWDKPFFVDADHITLKNVKGFLPSCDFYTIDVADAIGAPVSASEIENFVAAHPELSNPIEISGMDQALLISRRMVVDAARKYLAAAKQAGCIYRHIEAAKGEGTFITEVSMDETDQAQSPADLLVILATLADERVPLQTIAPKFTGRFNKGVDYAGNLEQFESEFRSDVAILSHAVRTYGFPPGLKLSIHSGSDKYSIYPAVRRAMRDFHAGVHVKTAGTTWLEELIGMAEGSNEGLALAKEIYAGAFEHREELCAPYATVIDIDVTKLPVPGQVMTWTSEQYVNALRHEKQCAQFNPSFRQLLHVGYKIAAKLGTRYLEMIEACEESIARNVTANLYERHIKPIFLAS